MTSIQYTQINQFSPLNLRRSDRKKTKKIIKDDFTLPNPFKAISKKHKSLKLPHNLDIQIKKIQFLTERTLAMLNYGKREFSLQMLNEMKQAVNQQQNKLNAFLPIKLNVEKNNQENKAPHFLHKMIKSHDQKENTPKIQSHLNINYSNVNYSNQNNNNVNYETELDKEVAGISTAEQLYCSLSESQIGQNMDIISAFDEQSEYCILDVPRFRKQSSKLLSDNYENNELLYTIEHIIPNWHKDEILNQQHEDEFMEQ